MPNMRLESFFNIKKEENIVNFFQSQQLSGLIGNNVYKIKGTYVQGFNDSGNLGLGEDAPQRVTTPTKLDTNLKFKEAYPLKHQTFLIDSNSKLYAMGSNTYGVLANDNYTTSIYTPTKIGNSKWKSLFFASKDTINGKTNPEGISVVYALDEHNELYRWGATNPKITSGSEIEKTLVEKVSNTKWTSVSIFSDYIANSEQQTYQILHTVFLLDVNNELYTFGDNNEFILGYDCPLGVQYTPNKVSDTKWKTIFPTFDGKSGQVCALDNNDCLYIWGTNNFGVVTNGTTTGYQITPYKVSDTKWAHVINGNGSIYAIEKTTGYMYVWGKNDVGQLGIGTTIDQYTPIKVSNTKWIAYVDVGLENNRIGVLDEDNILYTWGSGTNYGLGTGSLDNQYTPYRVSETKWKMAINRDSNYYSLNTTLLVSENDELYAFGQNEYGVAGVGTTTPCQTITKVSDTKWKNIQILDHSVFALAENNELYAFGYNSYGSLGIGTTTHQYTPCKVGTSKWYQVFGNSFTTVLFEKN